jgi:hypothetical protein
MTLDDATNATATAGHHPTAPHEASGAADHTRELPGGAALVAAATLVAAAGIHAAAAVGHAEQGTRHIAMFLAAALAESIAAVVVLAFRRLGAWCATVVSATLMLAWLASRTVGVFGDPAESVGAADLSVTGLHSVAIVASVICLRSPSPMAGRWWDRSNIAGLAGVAAALLVAVPSMTSASDGHNHGNASSATGLSGGADGHDHGGSDATAIDGTVLDGAASGETSTGSDGHGHDHGQGHQDGTTAAPGGLEAHGHADCQSSAPEQADADAFVAEIDALLATQYATYDRAEAAGFNSLGGRTPADSRGLNGTWHYQNPAHYGDGRILDPSAPEMIIYARDPDGVVAPVGVMFQLDGPNDEGPQPFGCLAAWHSHTQSVVPGEAATVPMLHVWTIDLAGGAFDHQGSPEYACRYLGETGVSQTYVVEPPACIARDASREEIISIVRGG